LINAYSSYAEYLGIRKTSWIKPTIILSYFDQANVIDFKRCNSYKKFVEEYQTDGSDILEDIVLEQES
jgi:hypothetical protein